MSLKARSVRPSTSISFFADSAHFVTQKLNHTESFSFLRLVYILAQWDFNIWSNIATLPGQGWITPEKLRNSFFVDQTELSNTEDQDESWKRSTLNMSSARTLHELYTNSTGAQHLGPGHDVVSSTAASRKKDDCVHSNQEELNLQLHYRLRCSIGFWNEQKVDKSRCLFLSQKHP